MFHFLENTISFFRSKITGEWPSLKQWRRLPHVLNKSERFFIVIFIFLFVASSIALIYGYYQSRTVVVPAEGGQYAEGIVGQPRFINPILSQASDADRDLAELIFSGLLKYDSSGELKPFLAESYKIEGNKVYIFSLKPGVKWHDNENFSADDVIFTIGLIQNPDYKSPLRPNWQGVQVEKIDDLTVKFTLPAPYAPFLENLTVGILPKHLWQNISASAFPLADYNLQPIGTGPFRFKNIQKDKLGSINSLTLEVWPQYHGQKPYLAQIIFKFFDGEDELLNAFEKREIEGVSFVSAINLERINKSGEINVYSLNLPRYYAVFFNQTNSKPLADRNVRLALQYATNKQEIIEKVLLAKGTPVDSPLPKELLNLAQDTAKKYDFSIEKAKEILAAGGWRDSNNDGVLEKAFENENTPTPLEINIVTTQWPELVQAAQIIQEQWQKIGAKINLEILDIGEIQQNKIIPRNYQAILFGEVLGLIPDPFSFWHSSQKKYPGLNLALYDNRDADKLLEDARQILDAEERVKKYAEFQKLVVNDVPAVFLYSPSYLYAVGKKIKGVDIKNIATPSQRFNGVENWHIQTKRGWK